MSVSLSRTAELTVLPGDEHAPYDAVHTRLCITIVCATLSIVADVVMFRAYRRYRGQLSNAYNDLYVFGLGGFQFLQSIQYVLFAAVHLAEMQTFSGPACIANAVLDQFLNFGGQVFALGFMVSMVTLRGQFDCCATATISAVRTVASYGTSAPQLLSEHRRAMMASDEMAAATNLAHVQHFHQQPDDDCTQRSAGRLNAAANASRIVWPLCALVGALGTTVWMCAVVVHDPDEAPELQHKAAPLNFELSLGWCWIPRAYPMLRFLCCYLLSSMTVLCGCISLGYLLRFEFRYSFRDHLPIYSRIGALIVWTLVAYLAGAVARFAGDPIDGGYAATAIFTLNGLFLSMIFLWTERAIGPFFSNDSLPGNGFSSCVNHLLLMEIPGIPLPQSASASRRRFESDVCADGGCFVQSTQHLLMLGREESYHVASCESSEAVDAKRGTAASYEVVAN